MQLCEAFLSEGKWDHSCLKEGEHLRVEGQTVVQGKPGFQGLRTWPFLHLLVLFGTWVTDKIWYMAKGHPKVGWAPIGFAWFCSDGNATTLSILLWAYLYNFVRYSHGECFGYAVSWKFLSGTFCTNLSQVRLEACLGLRDSPCKWREGVMKTKTRSSLAQGNKNQTFNMRRRVS